MLSQLPSILELKLRSVDQGAWMDYFGLSGDLARCEIALQSCHGRERLSVLVELAWYLRQRDVARARLLTQEARALLNIAGETDVNERIRLEGRLLAVEAVELWLSARLGDALGTIALARERFETAGDSVGTGDTLFIEADTLVHMTGFRAAEPFYTSAAEAYADAGDTLRLRICNAQSDAHRAFVPSPVDKRRKVSLGASHSPLEHPGLLASVERAEFAASAFAGNFARAIVHAQRHFELFSEVGEVNSAIIAAVNVGWAYSTLNDHAHALMWIERALELARLTGWPRALGAALTKMGETLRKLGRTVAARDVLKESLQVLQPFRGSRLQIDSSIEYGHVLFDLGEYPQALELFNECAEMSGRLEMGDSALWALCLQARTLSRIGEPSRAFACASKAFENASSSKLIDSEINALRALAEVSRVHRLPLPVGSTAASASIHYLEEALRACTQTEGYIVPDDLLHELSTDFEAAGDLANALTYARRAAEARDKSHSKETDNFATAMHVRHETEQARADAIHHKVLAEAEAAANRANAALLVKLRSLLAAAPVGIAFTRDECFDLVSAELCRHFNCVEDDLLGRPVRTVFDSDTDYATFVANVQTAFQAGEPYVSELRMARIDGTLFWAQLRGQPLNLGASEAGNIWTLSNVDRQVAERAELEWSATHDVLTGLANRNAFELQLKRVFDALPRSRPAALVLIDLDRFKPINDTEGHAAGDAMLKAVANAITSQVRVGDLVVRQGGDEFALLLLRCPPEAALRVAENVRTAIAAIALPWQGRTIRLGASLGVASLRKQIPDVASWVAAADAACYQAKAEGRNAVRSAPALVVVEQADSGQNNDQKHSSGEGA